MQGADSGIVAKCETQIGARALGDVFSQVVLRLNSDVASERCEARAER
jgi:hypothetical protein